MKVTLLFLLLSLSIFSNERTVHVSIDEVYFYFDKVSPYFLPRDKEFCAVFYYDAYGLFEESLMHFHRGNSKDAEKNFEKIPDILSAYHSCTFPYFLPQALEMGIGLKIQQNELERYPEAKKLIEEFYKEAN